MSEVINSYLTRILIAPESAQGTAETTFTHLWPSTESDGLTAGETPFDESAIRGSRGQLSTGFRQLQCLPGGNLGAAPIICNISSENLLSILKSHFQDGTETGAQAPYTYTFYPATASIDDGTFYTLTILKDTGITDKCQVYSGCIADELSISWESGGVMKWQPTFKAQNIVVTGTTPDAVALGTGGFLQPPNITFTYNGTEIYPTAWTFNSMNNSGDRVSGNARGRVGHVLGDWTGELEITTWRDDDFYTHFVEPFASNTIGTAVITATMDDTFGTVASGTPLTMTITLYVRVADSPALAVQSGDMTETVNFKVVMDTHPTIAVTQATSGII